VAVENLLNPDRVIIGHNETPDCLQAFEEFSKVYLNWIPGAKIKGTNTWTSEMIKMVNSKRVFVYAIIGTYIVICSYQNALCSQVSLASDAQDICIVNSLSAIIGVRRHLWQGGPSQ